jgi:hypothetical protein
LDAQAIIDAVRRVTESWAKQVRKEERDRSAYLRRQEALTRRRDDRVGLKDAVFAEMRAGIAQASGGGRTVYPKRNLYYSVRKLIQAHTAGELSYGYFEQVLQQWEEENGPAAGKYCDPRGYFVEPHTGQVIPLGSREVEGYPIPAWRFDKILYVEKKGFHELFKIGRIAERYDIGIICAEGYAVDAAKVLLARAEQSSRMTILCQHNADPFGYNIARRLRDATHLKAGTINVIDIGLFLGEAIDLGLDTEEFVRDKALPQGLELNEVERRYFEGRPEGQRHGRTQYRCRRVELNALAADPDRFIRYVEDKLRAHGCAAKLVPPAQVVLTEAELRRDELLQKMARDKVTELLNASGLAADLARLFAAKLTVHDLPDLLAEWAAGLVPESWVNRLRREIQVRVQALTGELGGEVLASIRTTAASL